MVAKKEKKIQNSDRSAHVRTWVRITWPWSLTHYREAKFIAFGGGPVLKTVGSDSQNNTTVDFAFETFIDAPITENFNPETSFHSGCFKAGGAADYSERASFPLELSSHFDFGC